MAPEAGLEPTSIQLCTYRLEGVAITRAAIIFIMVRGAGLEPTTSAL